MTKLIKIIHSAFQIRVEIFLKIISAVGIVVFALVLPLAAEASAQGVNGVWKGSYTCGKGQTGLTLEFVESSNGKLLSIFSFYDLQGNNRVPNGSFLGEVSDNNGAYSSMPIEWIQQPDRYAMVAFEGRLDSNGATMSGDIIYKGCRDFYVEKTSEPISKLASTYELTDFGPPIFAYSSFRGLDIDISGVRLDLNIRDSLLGVNPKYSFKQGSWSDSQGKSKRGQTGVQNFSSGNISDVRESVAVTPVPWHSGEFISKLTRELNIKPEEKMPEVSSFVSAVIEKYGEPTATDDKASRVGFIPTYSEKYLIYTIRSGSIAKVPCWDAGLSPFNVRTLDSERLAYYQKMLLQIEQGYCEAVMTHFYTLERRNRDRIDRYGARVRDFRLEAAAFIEDYERKREATERRQQNTPVGKPDL